MFETGGLGPLKIHVVELHGCSQPSIFLLQKLVFFKKWALLPNSIEALQGISHAISTEKDYMGVFANNHSTRNPQQPQKHCKSTEKLTEDGFVKSHP
jgi:hypothetical protein